MKKYVAVVGITILLSACGYSRNYDSEQHASFSTLYTVADTLYYKCGTPKLNNDIEKFAFYANSMKNYNRYEGAQMEKISNEIYKLSEEFLIRIRAASKAYCEQKLRIILTSLDKAMKASKTRMVYGY